MAGRRPFQASGMLRALAMAIAGAGVVDPAVTLTGSTLARLAVVEQEPTSLVSAGVRSQLVRDLGGAYEIVPEITSDAAAAIVNGERYPTSSARSSLGPRVLARLAL